MGGRHPEEEESIPAERGKTTHIVLGSSGAGSSQPGTGRLRRGSVFKDSVWNARDVGSIASTKKFLNTKGGTMHNIWNLGQYSRCTMDLSEGMD